MKSVLPLVLFALLPAALSAQTAPPASPAAAAATDEAVALSPFVVSSTTDNGYLAANTLAGSRMNTELRNVASVVSVFTPEFIADLGATTIEDLMEYGLNTQVDLGAGDFNHQGDQNSVADGIGQQKNFRVRGQESSVSMEYFGQAGPLDTYNLERAELSSGPNAILFGTGAAGGLLNMSLKRPNFRRPSLENKLVLGSFNERRFSTDINVPVVKDRVALRLQGLHATEDGWQRLGYKDTDRGTFSVLLRPFKKTEITASLEHGQVDQSKNSVASTALDSMTAWLNLRAANGGRTPLTTRTQALALGAAQAFAQFGVVEVNRHHYTIVTNDGFAANFRQSVESRSYLNNTPKSALSPQLMAPDINYYGPGTRQENRFRNLTVKLDQQITRDLFGQLSFFDSRTNGAATFPPLEDAVYVDANATLPNADGTPGAAANPYAGKLYMEDNWAFRTHNESDRIFRGTLAYQFAPRKWSWLGKHRIAGLAERHESTVTEDNLLEVWDIWSAVPAASRAAFTTTYGFNFNNPEAANNRIWRRNYLTEGNYETYYSGDGRVPAATTVGGFALKPKFVTASAAQDQLSLVTVSKMIATQSSFWKERVHVTLGYRWEDTDAKQSIGARDTSNTAAVGNPFVRTYEGTLPRTFASTTRTFGVVYHVLPQLSLFYNNSTNANSPNLRRNVFPLGSMGPPRRGSGDDMGFAVELLDRKLYVRAARFTNRAENGPGTFEVDVDLTAPNAALWDQIETIQNQAIAAGRISASNPALVTGPKLESYRVQGVDGDVFDETSKGYELQIVGNPTPQWRVSLNYGYSTRRRTNVLKLALAYEQMVRVAAEKWEKEFAAATNQATPIVVSQTFGRTIGEVYDRVESEMGETKATQEDFAFASRPHKVNLFTTYRFTQGWARGVRVGGGLIYQSPVTTGRFFYYRNSANGVKTVMVQPYNGALNPTQVLERVESIPGEAIYRVDFTGGYTRRVEVLGHKSSLSLQLNVRDVFDWNSPSARRYRPVGPDGGRVITRYNVFPPRTWRLTAGLDF
ncbi:MAG TPA: TonB-dependent receptor plug domain-containing protein [Opitutaceae bacterium]|nr:TonB-dependent receptor plug domain-containing protein [Opitutaceae bacterium]